MPVSPWVTGLHLIIALVIYDSAFTFVGLAYSCLLTEISNNASTRLRLIRWSRVGTLLGSSSVLFIEFRSDSLHHFEQFQVSCLIVTCCSCVLMVYAGLNAHTEYDLHAIKLKGADGNNGVLHEKTYDYPYWMLTWQVLKERNFVTFVITNFLQEFHRSFLSSFTVIICDQLVTEDVVPVWVRSMFYGTVIIASQVSYLPCLDFNSTNGAYI